jgi:hypothetical protein
VLIYTGPVYAAIFAVLPKGILLFEQRRHYMANAVLFIGWGTPVPGRERQALRVFNDSLQYYSRLQQEGQIESFEPVLLEQHGNELGSFILLRGDQEQLSRLRADTEFQHNTTRAGLVVENLGVVSGFLGDNLNRIMGDYQTQIDELT